MTQIPVLKLEILRAGPAHNQLLSPLTPYLALCQGGAVSTIHLPFEHQDVLRQLQTLAYDTPRALREAQVGQSASALGRILGGIPGISSGLARAQSRHPDLLHFRLVLSGAELALLPFEMAHSPEGFPGESLPLLLQAQMPLCITREVRRSMEEPVDWTRSPRILVAAAAPAGVAPVPLREHLLAIRLAADPWLPRGGEPGASLAAFKALVTVLPQARLADVRDACASGTYTHIHILAHGRSEERLGETRHGLAFHGANGGIDLVDGQRMADALRAVGRGEEGNSRPLSVFLASCDSGNVGSVLLPGASIAHDLHSAGIPWVMASQFPLSIKGSVLMTEVWYRRILRGDDPRRVLYDLRQRLHAECPTTHDWASVVAYARLPADFEAQVRDGKQERTHQAIEALFASADRLLMTGRTSRNDQAPPGERQEVAQRAVATLARLEQQYAALKETVPLGQTTHDPLDLAERAQVFWLMARSEKRRAQILFEREDHQSRASQGDRETKEAGADAEASWKTCLRSAQKHYRNAAQADLRHPFAAVQYLSLTCVLQGTLPEEWVAVARFTARLSLDSFEPGPTAMATVSLIELCLLEVANGREGAKEEALAYTNRLVRSTEPTFRESAQHLLRQIDRYLTWWKLDARGTDLAREIQKMLRTREFVA